MYIMKRLLLLFLISIFPVLSFGQMKDSQAIDSIFSEWNTSTTPGCALGIMKNGELIYSKGYGLANMEYNIPNSASSVFRIGSTSKQFTAACIIILAEQGKLNLKDNVKSFFPDFPDYAEKITIQHLLNHTSGIRDYLQLAYLKGLGQNDFYTDAHVMQWLVNQSDLNFHPGEEFLYSNSGYWLLGQIVGKVSGINMADFAQKELFEPLGMNNTHFHNDHKRIVKNRASGYNPIENGNFRISMTTLDMIGDGGIFTTINDIKRWDDAFYSSSVLSETFWNTMTKQGTLNSGEVIDYASGLGIEEYKGLKTIRHGGGFVGFRAELLRFPEERLSIVIFANRSDADPVKMANQVADVLLEGKLIENPTTEKESKRQMPQEEEFQLDQLTGKYEIEPGLLVHLSVKDDSLNVAQVWNKKSYNIASISKNTYQRPGNKDLTFIFSDLKKKQVQTLLIVQEGRETKADRKQEVDISNINLNDYTGIYFSKELDVIYYFKLEEGSLMARVENNLSLMDLTVTDFDQFAGEIGLVRFQRKDGVISGFELDSGRVKNLKFEKKKEKEKKVQGEQKKN